MYPQGGIGRLVAGPVDDAQVHRGRRGVHADRAALVYRRRLDVDRGIVQVRVSVRAAPVKPVVGRGRIDVDRGAFAPAGESAGGRVQGRPPVVETRRRVVPETELRRHRSRRVRPKPERGKRCRGARAEPRPGRRHRRRMGPQRNVRITIRRLRRRAQRRLPRTPVVCQLGRQLLLLHPETNTTFNTSILYQPDVCFRTEFKRKRKEA